MTIGIKIDKEASNTHIENCDFVGLEEGVHDEGTDTKVVTSRFWGATQKKVMHWFSMDNPMTYLLIIGIIAFLSWLV